MTEPSANTLADMQESMSCEPISVNQMAALLSGQLLAKFTKTLRMLEDHVQSEGCQECMQVYADKILKNCHTCKQK